MSSTDPKSSQNGVDKHAEQITNQILPQKTASNPEVTISKPYKVTIREFPLKGKMCGISNIPSRSYLYPGLVLQIDFVGQYPSRKALEAFVFVCNVSLVDEKLRDCTTIPWYDKRPRKDKQGNVQAIDLWLSTIAGQRTVQSQILNDPEDGLAKLFLVFSDISIRITGTYRLKCQVINMTDPELHIDTVITEPFRMYSLHTFSISGEPTKLSRSFTLQGINPSGRTYSANKIPRQ